MDHQQKMGEAWEKSFKAVVYAVADYVEADGFDSLAFIQACYERKG